MLTTKWLLLTMDKDGRLKFWHIWCYNVVVLGNVHLFYFLFPSYQITCVDFVSPFGDKSLEKKLWYVSMFSTHPL
jgi:hypothetical protein